MIATLERSPAKQVGLALDTALIPRTGENSTSIDLSSTSTKLHSLLRNVWKLLARAGEYRAACEVGRYLRMRGVVPSGNLDQDVAQLLALRDRP